MTVGANTWLDAKVALNPKQKVTNISDLLLRIRAGSMHVEDEAVDDWWMNLSAKRLSYHATSRRPPREP